MIALMAKRNLSKHEIIEEALQLLDKDGLDGMSMRKLALRLGVRAPTLYYHIPDKSALLNEVTLVLFERSLDRMPPCDTWQEWMAAFGEAIWGVQQEARYAPALLLNIHLDEEHFVRSADRLRNEIMPFGLDQEKLFFIQSAVQAVVTGWSIFAHATYSDKVGRYVDFREAALSSVRALIQGWEPKMTAANTREPQTF
jgi:TetR/AcrR family transcriptional regulator, tetracycline repressor protein